MFKFLTQKYSPLFTAAANTKCHSVQVFSVPEFEGKAPWPKATDLILGGRLVFLVPGEAAFAMPPLIFCLKVVKQG